MTSKSTVENADNGEVATKAMEGSVYEITKDLREVETKESAGTGNGGIDWNWDGETDDNHNNDDENDSDATSVMLSSEDEAEEDSGDIECGGGGNDGDEKIDHNDGATSTTFRTPPVDSKTNTESSSNDAVEKTSRKDEDHYNGKGKEDYSSKNDDDFPFNDNEDDADDELSVGGGDGPIHDAYQPLLEEDNDESMLETQPSTVGDVASGNDDEEMATEGDDDDDDSIVANPSSGKKQDKSKTKGKKGKGANKSSVVVTKKGKKRKAKQPDLDDLLRSTDVLFELADDKNAVKVSEINESLEVEYDCQLSKANKKAVRAHLTDLINRKDEVNDSQLSDDAESEASEDDDDSDSAEKPKTTKKGRRYTKSGRKNKKLSKAEATSDDDLEDSDEENATSQPANESESEASNDDEDKPKTSNRKGRKQTKKLSRKRHGSSKTDDFQESDDESSFGQPDESESEASDNEEGEKPKKKRKVKKQKKVGKKKITKPKPLSKRKAAKAARLIEAERLRKKRMEELRIRNEEMQLNISKEERERSEKIAARFDTDTGELRAKRLEDRLNLLQALDKKRFEVVEIKDDDEPEKRATTPKLGDEKKAKEGSDSEEESSDDEDLEIVGVAKPLKPMKPIHTHFKSKALDVLKKLRSPDGQKTKTRPKTIISPGTSNMNARNALRSKLKERQRTAGNRWLARELGYKTEQEHLKDCQTAVNQKREQVIKFEQLRLKANERKQLRERMLLADDEAPADEDEGEEEFKPGDTPDAADEEENEELRLARQIEQENDKVESVSEPTSVNDETTQGPPDDAGIADTEQIEETVDESQDMFDESQRLETQPTLDATAPRDTLVSKVSAEESDTGDAEGTEKSMDEDVFDESQRLETQPPPDIPVIDSFTRMTPRIVSAESEDSTSESHEANDGTSSGGTTTVEKSAETTAPTSKLESDDDDEPEEELEFVDNAPDASVETEGTVETARESNKPRNAGWQAMLKREAEKLKKQNIRRNAGDLFEEEAEEEEEEEVAGLEDFGFSVKKKDKNGDDEDKANDDLDEEDLKHIVDELSDDEGDEEAGRKARKRQQEREEKERHKDMLRRMREGYDGRRGGIAGGAGARGLHRFDQLVAADNREDAKRLGLLNDDEMDSEDEEKKSGDNDDEEDENALLDKMLKDRFLHRSSNVDLEEQFSDSDEEENPAADNDPGNLSEEEEERTQERLARRFAKRARMQRLEEMYSESQEFSQQRMIDEDESMKIELQSMKNGLLRKRSVSSSRSSFSEQQGSNLPCIKRQRSCSSSTATFGGSFMDKNGSLSVALRASRKTKHRTSFLGGAQVGDSNNKRASGFVHRSVSLNRVVFHQSTSRSSLSNSNLAGNLVGKGGNVGTGKRKERPGNVPTSLFSKVAGRG